MIPAPSEQTIAVGPKQMPISQASVIFDERGETLNYQREHADKGNPEAQFAMGIRYLNGIDVPKDEDAARAYLEKAAKQGNLRAINKLEEFRAVKRKARIQAEAAGLLVAQ